MDFNAAADLCAPMVARPTLAAIVRVESRFDPLAIGINGRRVRLSRAPRNQAEAVDAATRLIAAGHSVDLGWGQVNSRNLARLGLTVTQAFDPCTNLRASSRVLTDCYVRASRRFGAGQSGLRAALSCYNTGSFERGVSNGYVQRIFTSAAALPREQR